MIYLGYLRRDERPASGSRYGVGAIVVNLTGRGSASFDLKLAESGLRTCLQVVERNLCDEDAGATLASIAAGTVDVCLLPWIPLMHDGGESGIIQQWLTLASAESDPRRRGDYGGLALVFAEAAGYRAVWKQALQGWNMVQSQQVLEWMAEGEAKGEVKGKAAAVIRVLQARFQRLPVDLEQAIRSTTDLDQLDRWLEDAALATSCDAFRKAAGI